MIARPFTVLERGHLLCGALPAAEDRPWRRGLPEPVFQLLKRQEQEREARGEEAVFTWGSRRGVETATVGPWVGVMEVGSSQIEILPKVDLEERPERLANEKALGEVRGNLLEMLAYAGSVPIRVRGQASLSLRKGTLQDALVQLFLDRLVTELLRGEPRAYEAHEDELGTIRGRLMVQRQITRNAAKPHRLWCRFDELEFDPHLAGRFRAACDLLQRRRLGGESRRLLAQAGALLAEAPTTPPPSVAPIVFNRQNERFHDIYDFAGYIIDNNAPDPRTGTARSFSLLYQMDLLFESFVAGFIQREVLGTDEPGSPLSGWDLRPQGRGEPRYLMRRVEAERTRGKGVLHMKPDLLFHKDGQSYVADTKWKRLEPGSGATPSRDDLYQLYAYLREYDCQRVTLLYPAAMDAQGPDLCLDKEADKVVGVRFLNLAVDLATTEGRAHLASQLRGIITEGVGASCKEEKQLTPRVTLPVSAHVALKEAGT